MKLLDRYKSLSIQTKATVWYTVCNFLQKGISLIVVPIYVRLLTTGEYGNWSVFQSWAAILMIFASLNLYCGVYTKKLVDMPDEKERDRYTSSMQGLGTLTTLLLFVLYLCTMNWSNRMIGLTTPLMLLLFSYFVVYPAFSFWVTRQRVEYKYISMVVVTMIVSALIPACGVLLLEYTDLREKALVVSFLLIQCLVGLVFYVYQFVKGKCLFDRKYWKYATKFNIPLVPHYLSLIVLNQSDRIMIKEMCGESDAGIYSFAYQIASVINVLTLAVNAARVPWTYEQLRIKEYESIRKITNALVALIAGLVFIASLFSPEIIHILGTGDYQVAVYVIPVVIAGVFFTFVYDFYASIEFYYGATRYVMYASVIGAVLNVLLNIVFISEYGFIAAAYTTLVCYLVFMLLHFWFSKRVLAEQGINRTIYDSKIVFSISFLTMLFCLGCMMTFNYPIVRFSLIIVIAGVFLMNRKSVMRLLKKIRE